MRSFFNNKVTISHNKGFTLLELLLVVAIIAILASVIFVILDPPTRFKNTRDSARFSDVVSLSNAIALNQLDNGGSYLQSIQAVTVDEPYMISSATTTSGCIVTCDASISSNANCVNLIGLVGAGNVGELPVSPNGSQTWTTILTGYYLTRNTNGSVTIGACESENTSDINVTQ